MLTDIQKTAIRTMLSITKASPERMAAIGENDAYALSELNAFVSSRLNDLDIQENDLELEKAAKEKELLKIRNERALWVSLNN